MANFRRPADQTVRDEYLESQRWLTDMMVRLSDSKGGAWALARLDRLENGETVTVQGWQIGLGGPDFSPYELAGDGRVTPIAHESLARPLVGVRSARVVAHPPGRVPPSGASSRTSPNRKVKK